MKKFKVIVLLDGNYEVKYKVKGQTPIEAEDKARPAGRRPEGTSS